jgi:hypothetical protein
MHYASPMQRFNQADANTKLDVQIHKLKSEIKSGDDEMSSFSDRNPYNTFELMQRAQAWRHKRFRLSTELGKLEQAKQWSAADTEWKPATPGFVGSER